MLIRAYPEARRKAVVVDKACQVAVIIGDFAPLQLGEVEERLVEGIDIFHILSPLFGVEDPAAHPELRRTRSNFTWEKSKSSVVVLMVWIRPALNNQPKTRANTEQTESSKQKATKAPGSHRIGGSFSQWNQRLVKGALCGDSTARGKFHTTNK